MKLLIKGGRVIDPANNIDDTLDLLIENGEIIKIAKSITESEAKTVNAIGNVVAPGFIDMHVHLREPGDEESETILTGARAAAAGGFTAIACMPNTNPVNDNASVTEYILSQALIQSDVNIYPIGALSKGLAGEELSEIGELYNAGCVAISDDGKPVMDNELMRRALEYSSMFSMPVIDHCEASDLSEDGVMNEGYYSTILGLRGIPASSEEIIVQRDIILSRDTGAHVHIAHVSTAESVDLIRRAKKRGITVTAEVTPHHFTLTDDKCMNYDTNFKMKPPLRSEKDLKGILKGIKDGTIDCIATDHAPHHIDKKALEFDYAAFGIIGLETAIPLALDRLLHTGILDLRSLVEMFSVNPARILNVEGGKLSIGSRADITILNFNKIITIDKKKFHSKSRNTPFDGYKLKGSPVMTIVAGEIVWSADG